MSTKGCEGLYQTGYKGVGYVNHARVACNVTGLFARAGSPLDKVCARSIDGRISAYRWIKNGFQIITCRMLNHRLLR